MLGKRHLPKEVNIDDIRNMEQRATELRSIYCKILYDFLKDIEYIKLGDFDTPNWEYKRAFQDGMVHAYKTILEIIGE